MHINAGIIFNILDHCVELCCYVLAFVCAMQISCLTAKMLSGDRFDADHFDVTRDLSASLSFGAGPHYCAGAWASRALIAEAALPEFFERVQNPQIAGDVPFGGWAFRGPLALPCKWDRVETR